MGALFSFGDGLMALFVVLLRSSRCISSSFKVKSPSWKLNVMLVLAKNGTNQTPSLSFGHPELVV
jgi:hypothetical protein